MSLPRLISQAAAARYLGVSRARVVALVKDGQLGTIQFEGRIYINPDTAERLKRNARPRHPNQTGLRNDTYQPRVPPL